ncbi:MAG: hypothetical protein ACOCX1_01580 [Fimbriimonadaceae bacterium]
MSYTVQPTRDATLNRMLAQHPLLKLADAKPRDDLCFERGDGWKRRVRVGDPHAEVKGLIELIDNNPVVCADTVSVPSPAATLALIALGPISRAAILADEPLIQTNAPVEGDESLYPFLEAMGLRGQVTCEASGAELGSVYAATVLAPVETPDDPSDLDALYEEALGGKFFVRRDEQNEWDTALVSGKTHAVYRLRITPDEPTSLLRIQVMADREGKCGAAQLLHALNVMAGFEETTGVPESLSREL